MPSLESSACACVAAASLFEKRLCVSEQVSLDLASFELVRGCTPALLDILGENLVDVLLANDEEAAAFRGAVAASSADTPVGPESSPAAVSRAPNGIRRVMAHSRGADECSGSGSKAAAGDRRRAQTPTRAHGDHDGADPPPAELPARREDGHLAPDTADCASVSPAVAADSGQAPELSLPAGVLESQQAMLKYCQVRRSAGSPRWNPDSADFVHSSRWLLGRQSPTVLSGHASGCRDHPRRSRLLGTKQERRQRQMLG